MQLKCPIKQKKYLAKLDKKERKKNTTKNIYFKNPNKKREK
jgi:hypothetical protein